MCSVPFLSWHGNDVLRSVVKHMMIYALGRPLDVTDDKRSAAL